MKDLRIYQHILDISKRVIAEADINRLLTIALDAAIELTVAERGLIILFDKDNHIIFQTARNIENTDIDNPQFEVSRSIINKVRQAGKSLCLENALNDQKLRSESTIRLKILSVLCFPLLKDNDIFGVIYLDNRSLQGMFTEKCEMLIDEFADFISSAAHNALLQQRLMNRVSELGREIRSRYELKSIIGHHPKMIHILKLIGQVSKTDASVLIQGESGTGKELIARALHTNSPRKNKPFIPINCGALPVNLLESELFGHAKGAFTGAVKDKMGWFERAQNGTIFLDEISEMTQALQVKLLRILQTGEYSPVGSTEILQSDVRIIAATNQVLENLVKETTFREDLFYRLNVINIDLPPLRDRKTDLPLLIQHFLKIYNLKEGQKKKYISKDAEKMLLNYHYPGNIRELENIIQRAVILSEGNLIKSQHLPEIVKESYDTAFPKKDVTLTDIKRTAAEKAEQEFIIFCLEATNGHISNAAVKAGINVSNFHKSMKKYRIKAIDFKSSK